MKFWTIRRAEELEAFQHDGVLRTDAAQVDPDFRAAYDWMRQQLNVQIGPPPLGVIYPIWVWRYWQGTTRARPDLRTKCLLPRGALGVRLELDLPAESVLLSNFDGWHAVLNNHYYTLNDEEYEHFEKSIGQQGKNHPDFIAMKMDSWQRIFDLALIPDPLNWPVQGVVWEIPFYRVSAIDYFTAR